MTEGPGERDETADAGDSGEAELRPPTTEYPANLLTPTSHLPSAGELPPLTGQFPVAPQQDRTKAQTAAITGSIAAIVVVVIAVVVIVIAKPGGGQAGQPTGAAQTSTAATPSTATSGSAASSSAPSAIPEGWHEVAGSTGSGLVYSAPPDWRDSGKSRSTGRGEQWGGVAEYGSYQCPLGTYTRGFVAAGKAPTGDRTDLGALAAGYAKSLANHWYDQPRTEPADPQPRQVDGHEAALATLKVSVTPQDPKCDASSGEVVVLAVRLDQGVGVVAVVNDLDGGPSDPPCAPDGSVQQILGTVRVR